jgi:hypothetical protein
MSTLEGIQQQQSLLHDFSSNILSSHKPVFNFTPHILKIYIRYKYEWFETADWTCKLLKNMEIGNKHLME